MFPTTVSIIKKVESPWIPAHNHDKVAEINSNGPFVFTEKKEKKSFSQTLVTSKNHITQYVLNKMF